MVADNLLSEGVDVDLVIERLSNRLNVKSDRALSKEMGLSLSAVNQARKRGSLPWEGLIGLCKAKGISLDWLFDINPSDNKKHNLGPTPELIHSKVNVDKELIRAELISVSTFVDEVMDQVLEKDMPASRVLEIRKSLAPILVDAAIEYDMDKAIVAAVARSTLKLV
ncbi:bacteriophage CI repressor [Pseudoalteromonas sp. JBTF-M23]|uniref:Bacteriophage CI repressor n=1 Tax=Pseudoalteromonas caenipelagi TaxID=2726988 RepID=A0A849VBT8_9GAMM|nr:helix-turn-helix domain-containing protein [Pseudoalteromonas caenipelagi]NOU50250.1 bacteriophage CI repressor [Pseudoalteromonas caenipelagi]